MSFLVDRQPAEGRTCLVLNGRNPDAAGDGFSRSWAFLSIVQLSPVVFRQSVKVLIFYCFPKRSMQKLFFYYSPAIHACPHWRVMHFIRHLSDFERVLYFDIFPSCSTFARNNKGLRMKVDILLASYNGERFIRQQLFSLLAQTFQNWRLYVRDDGSIDSTCEIVKQFADKDDRITIVEDNKGHLGCKNNFLELLKYSKNEFAIFCDQDDVWLENKLETLVEALASKDQSIPQLVYADSYSYQDGKVSPEGVHISVTDLRDYLFAAGGIQGSSSLFNAQLRSLMLRYRGDVFMHDHLSAMLAFLFGEVTRLNMPLMLYRKHDKNVIGKQTTRFDAVKSFFTEGNKRGILNREALLEIQGIASFFGDEIPEERKRLLDAFLDFPNLNRLQMIRSVFSNKFTLYGSSLPIILKILTRKAVGTSDKISSMVS